MCERSAGAGTSSTHIMRLVLLGFGWAALPNLWGRWDGAEPLPIRAWPSDGRPFALTGRTPPLVKSDQIPREGRWRLAVRGYVPASDAHE